MEILLHRNWACQIITKEFMPEQCGLRGSKVCEPILRFLVWNDMPRLKSVTLATYLYSLPLSQRMLFTLIVIYCPTVGLVPMCTLLPLFTLLLRIRALLLFMRITQLSLYLSLVHRLTFTRSHLRATMPTTLLFLPPRFRVHSPLPSKFSTRPPMVIILLQIYRHHLVSTMRRRRIPLAVVSQRMRGISRISYIKPSPTIRLPMDSIVSTALRQFSTMSSNLAVQRLFLSLYHPQYQHALILSATALPLVLPPL
mmetsp:Transcript_12307/g.18647  ORF Transcript_12307/g.18647 Transcript_12307/m.18647 type:complete len:254 (+) Transcript_12307:453-1214(+)